MSSSEDLSGQAYWKANIRLVTIHLIVWAFVSYFCGIILRPAFSGIAVGGADLGFWFAQQGSMFIFIAQIFIYAAQMNKLDRKFDVHED
jgi:putative solute:sodium symporter small subunit